MKQRPLRTLRVVLFANEEFGLSGARRYALDHEAELGRHTAAIEADLGSGRVFRFESQVRSAELPAVVRVAELLAPLGVPFTSNDSGGGADVGPMRERGVPAFELQHDASKYFEIHHTDADRLDRVERVGPGVQRRRLCDGCVGARGAADRDSRRSTGPGRP